MRCVASNDTRISGIDLRSGRVPVAKKKAARKATKKTVKKTSKKATKKKAKNSLVDNINKRKKAGTSRSKAKSTISKKAYRDMQEGWPDK
jgi:hypothetical protein